jgi:hypothetical protein
VTTTAALPVRRADRVGNALTRVLECVNASAQQNQVTLPTRQYITTGEIVYDCEEVVVSLGGLTLGSVAFEFDLQGCDVSSAPKKITVTVVIVRCMKVMNDNGTMIPATKMTEKILNVTPDGWVLMDMLSCLGDGVIGEVVYEGPDSGMIATSMTFEMQV